MPDKIQHLLVVIFSSAAGISNSVSELFKWHDHRIRYRTSIEGLKSETSLYLGAVDPYSALREKDQVFLKVIENISLMENKEWKQNEAKNDEKESESDTQDE